MLKQLLIFIILVVNIPCFSQNQTSLQEGSDKMTLGLNFGTGFFQHIKMNLTNFNQENITTSDNLVSTNIKASFNYYITPKVAVRFSSGYGFARQTSVGEVDYGAIDSMNVKIDNESIFSMVGFPVETTLLFQTAIDNNENLLIHVGIGMGYYSYNYKAEGSLKESYSESNETKLTEEYINPEMTLSGWAQFFTLGLNINLSQNMGASLEISKIGLSYMHIRNDIIKQQIDDHEIEYEYNYGYRQQDYKSRSGLEDVAISLGIYWRL